MSVVSFPLSTGGWLLLDEADWHLLEGKAVCQHSEGYIRIGRDYLHRLIVAAAKGAVVDHINGDKMDNRRANLRCGTKAQNGFNRGKAAHNTTGYKGVYFCKQTGRYRASVTSNSRVVRLGRFDDAEDAARAYDDAARRLHGEFAQLNFTEARDSGSIGKGCGE